MMQCDQSEDAFKNVASTCTNAQNFLFLSFGICSNLKIIKDRSTGAKGCPVILNPGLFSPQKKISPPQPQRPAKCDGCVVMSFNHLCKIL